jgi:hypothetical protein
MLASSSTSARGARLFFVQRQATAVFSAPTERLNARPSKKAKRTAVPSSTGTPGIPRSGYPASREAVPAAAAEEAAVRVAA